MKMSRGTIKLTILCAIGIGLLLLTSPVWAQPVTVFYSGIGSGLHFTGNYTFDTDWADYDPSTEEGLYSGAGYPYLLNFNWYDPNVGLPGNGYGFNSFDIFVHDRQPGADFPDAYMIKAREDYAWGSRTLELIFVDLYGANNRSILTSDAMVANPYETFGSRPNNTFFAYNLFYWDGRPGTYLTGNINFMYAPEADPAPVPEPSTFVLLVGGMMTLATWRKLGLKC